MSEQLSLFTFEKRWTGRRERWVTPAERFLPAGYSVDVISERLARDFVVREHYSGTFPAARLSVGLWGPGPELVGAAVFSVPMSEAVLRRWTGQDHRDAVELGRFVCSPSVRFNGETWFLRRAFSALRREKRITAILSFADPLERHTAEGMLTKPAHHGTIYMAKGALFAGRTERRRLLLAPDGRVVNERMLSKIRNGERGIDYAVRRLLDLGAPARNRGEEWPAWLHRVLRPPRFRRAYHPGNYAYLFGLDAQAAGRLSELHGGGLPYPRRSTKYLTPPNEELPVAA